MVKTCTSLHLNTCTVVATSTIITTASTTAITTAAIITTITLTLTLTHPYTHPPRLTFTPLTLGPALLPHTHLHPSHSPPPLDRQEERSTRRNSGETCGSRTHTRKHTHTHTHHPDVFIPQVQTPRRPHTHLAPHKHTLSHIHTHTLTHTFTYTQTHPPGGLDVPFATHRQRDTRCHAQQRQKDNAGVYVRLKYTYILSSLLMLALIALV